MTFLSNELNQSLDRYDEMQSNHFQSISVFRDQAPDLIKLNFQRARAFEELKNQLRCHLNKDQADSNASNNQEFMGRLEKIINKEKMIESLASEYRHAIIRQKSRMQQGKKALKGYGDNCISCSP